jgi:hypothetical protein
MSKYDYHTLPIKDKAYFIVVGINGSWLWNSMYPHVDTEEFCKSIVDNFESEHYVTDFPEIQQHIDDCYEDIMEYRAARVLKGLRELREECE